MNYYDAHNHLQSGELNQSHAEIFQLYETLGVRKVVVNGTRPGDWPAVMALAKQHPNIVIPSFGLHPWHVNEAVGVWKNELCGFLDHCPTGVIGEIGFDKWIAEPDLPKQADAFQFQMAEARKRNRPVTIHCLKAWGLLLDNLAASHPFLLHSYSGSAELIPQFAALGAYFSVSGYFAHERKAKQRETLKQIPLDRLLIETDAPDMLPPSPLKAYPLPLVDGREPNHPANIVAIYSFVAALFGLTPGELSAQVEQNFKQLFASSFV